MIDYFITVYPDIATVFLNFQSFFAPKQGIFADLLSGVAFCLISKRDLDGQFAPSPSPDLAASGKEARVDARIFRAAGLDDARDQKLSLLHHGVLLHHRASVQRQHARHERAALRHDVGRLPLVDNLGHFLALAHDNVGAAAAHVDRQPRKLRQLEQRVVAQVL